jgi:proton-translocating NAD(P)+ transhydrogenase subunit beta
MSVFGAAMAGVGLLVADPTQKPVMIAVSALALFFGVLLVTRIGGADMPTVISLLNSFAGLSGAALGFVLNNKVLIIAGALDGSSGLLLSIIMCRAMNRSFANVLFGGFGKEAGGAGRSEERPIRSTTAEEAAMILDSARLAVIVPGYGMAAAQAQHKIAELADMLERHGVEVKFAIHPVAGRMPGHMNVLLAEANVPYDHLFDLDQINPDLPRADVVLVVGANDVVNPAARTQPDSPIYGMPIIDADKAQCVIVMKRSMRSGFAGVENELFYLDKTLMLFGDARTAAGEIVSELSKMSPVGAR